MKTEIIKKEKKINIKYKFAPKRMETLEKYLEKKGY